MKTFLILKRYTWFLLLSLPVIGTCQNREFRFFPIVGIEPRQQSFAGRVNDHFFMVNSTAKPGLELYIYDSTVRDGVVRSFDFPKTLSAIIVKPNSILFTALQPAKTGVSFHFIELDKNGEVIMKTEGLLDGWRGPVNSITSSDKKQMLLYQFRRRSADSVLIKGLLLDQNGDAKKSIAYVFRQSNELDAEAELFLDVFGNTHILVYDRFANYRLSTDLTVNTIPVADEQIVSETFTLEKVKFKNMRVFQNNECKCIQAEGMYVDGFGKGNKGIYSIAFPPGRKNELAPRFIPFNERMIKNLKQGFSATEENILNSIQLQEIIYSDSGSFAILRVAAGIPQKLQHIRPEEDPSVQWSNRAVNSSRAGDVLSSINPNAVASGRAAIRVSNIQNGGRSTGMLPLRTAGSLPPVMSKGYGRNAPKLICVKLEKEKGFEWMQSRALDVFTPGYDFYNQVSIIPGEKKEISALIYEGDKFNEPYPVLITMKDGKQILQQFPEKKLWFSSFLFLDPQQYASLYFNPDTGKGGLMVISGKE